MITGSWISQMVYVAAMLGLAVRLAGGPKTADDLAQDTGTHARSLYRLLSALACVGVFSEDAHQPASARSASSSAETSSGHCRTGSGAHSNP